MLVATSLFSLPKYLFHCLGWSVHHSLTAQPHSPAETVSSRTSRGAAGMSNSLTCSTSPGLLKWTKFVKSYLSFLSKYGLCLLKRIRRSSRSKWQVWGVYFRNNEKRLREKSPSQPARLQLQKTSGQILPLICWAEDMLMPVYNHKTETETAGALKKINLEGRNNSYVWFLWKLRLNTFPKQ